MLSLHRLTSSLGRNRSLDPLADGLARTVAPLQSAPAVKDALNGVWLEHPLHPLMIAMPIGAWAAAGIYDVLGGRDARDTADRLVGLGIATAVPTAAAGAAQWVDLDGEARRIGAVHATVNTIALALQIASWQARRKGKRATGTVLSAAALGAMTVGGYLGGHLAYALGAGVDHTAFETALRDWTSTGVSLTELEEGRLRAAEAGGERVVLTRLDGDVVAYAERCTHEGGPLSEGAVVDDGGRPCVQCPWHGSRFRLADGGVAQSPATVPARRYETRLSSGVVEVRLDVM